MILILTVWKEAREDSGFFFKPYYRPTDLQSPKYQKFCELLELLILEHQDFIC